MESSNKTHTHDHHAHACNCGCNCHEHEKKEDDEDEGHQIEAQYITKEFTLSGLNCASCGAKIEKIVNNLSGVEKTNLNFNTSKLEVKVKKEYADGLGERVERIVLKLEPDVEVAESSKMLNKEYILEGLNCAGCAGKIERIVGELPGVIKSELNFATSKLNIEIKDSYSLGITEEIEKIVLKLEPDVKVIEKITGLSEVSKEVSGDKEKAKKSNKLLIRMGLTIAFLGLGFFFGDTNLGFISFIISYLIIGSDIIKRSFNNIRQKEIFDENFLMTIATFAAIAVGEYPEAVMVMLLYQIGEYFQGRAVESSRKSIANLMDIRPEYANLKVGNEINKVSPEEVKIGDIIVVRPGEKIPLDGIIIEGSSSIDTKALTGESVPRDVDVNDEITSGSINIDGLLTIKVEKTFKESAVSKILDLVQNASGKKAKTELRITKFAKYYTPIVVLIAVLVSVLPPLLVTGEAFKDWLLRGATFLVISCPCALVISIPLTYFAGLGATSKKGVLVKGGNYLEALSKAGVVVFDKTGTLTEGKFRVSEIVSQGISKEELLKLTAYIESYSTHPIAVSIVNEYGKEIDKEKIKDYKEVRGKGVEAFIDEDKIIAGNIRFLKDKGIEVTEADAPGTIVYTAINGEYIGYIVIADQIKKDAKSAIEGFNKLGIDNIVMLTGDRKITADSVAKELNIKKYKHELLPDQKVAEVEKLISAKGDKSLVFVGDGINDAPVLARADVGVAMGGVGSDAAIEAADVVIMNDEPAKLISAIKTAKSTRGIANQNIFLSISIKLVIMGFAFVGLAPMWLAVFGDVGVAIIAVFNAMRVLKK